MAIKFLIDLVSLQYCLASVDHNDVIASVEKRSPLRATLTGQDRSNLRREMADRLTARINHVPFRLPARSLPLGKYVDIVNYLCFQRIKRERLEYLRGEKVVKVTRLLVVERVRLIKRPLSFRTQGLVDRDCNRRYGLSGVLSESSRRYV